MSTAISDFECLVRTTPRLKLSRQKRNTQAFRTASPARDAANYTLGRKGCLNARFTHLGDDAEPPPADTLLRG
jgi:hypothetical protein